MTTQPQHLVQVRTPTDLIPVIPYLLGFQPRESVVLVGFRREPKLRTCLHLRVDLLPPGSRAEAWDELAAWLVSRTRPTGPEGLLVVLYRDAAGGPDDDDLAAYAALDTAITLAGLETVDGFAVRDGRRYSLHCAVATCCPPDGVPVDQGGERVVSEAVFAGLTAAPSREDVVRRLAPVDGPAAMQVAQACDAATERWLVEHAETGRPGVVRIGAALRGTWRQLLRGGDAAVDPETVADLLLGFGVVSMRDELIHLAYPAPVRGRAITLLTELVRLAPDDLVPGPATALGLLSWREGDGAFALMALERALDADPGYRYANLLMTGLQGGVPPSELDRVIAGSLPKRRRRRV